jgi:hypothetical protein
MIYHMYGYHRSNRDHSATAFHSYYPYHRLHSKHRGVELPASMNIIIIHLEHHCASGVELFGLRRIDQRKIRISGVYIIIIYALGDTLLLHLNHPQRFEINMPQAINLSPPSSLGSPLFTVLQPIPKTFPSVGYLSQCTQHKTSNNVNFILYTQKK